MHTQFSTLPIRAILSLATLFVAGNSTLQAIDFTENFDGASLDPLLWESTGPKTRSLATGRLTYADDGGNWGSGDISSQARYFLPPPGETTTITWTLGPGAITTVNPADEGKTLRYQVGIHSANEPSIRREHWVNTTGGLWLDLDVIQPTNTGAVSGFAAFANDTKVANSQGSSLGNFTLLWNWQTENHILKLTLTDTQYSWFDGDTLLFTDTWANAGIDTEFGNGFRVLGVGMNFNSGRGTTSFEKIEIANAAGPPALLTSFGAAKLEAFAGQKLNLNWVVDPLADISINQGIGDVSGFTTDGIGQYRVTLPLVEVPTAFPFILTVTKDAETISRTLQINVKPVPELDTESYVDHFDEGFLDTNRWETLGDQTYSIADSKIIWAADGTNWSHGEITSKQAYPVPTAGNPTTITWTWGPGSVAASNEDGTAIRPLMGIYSAYETHTWSRQHWQNTTGGIWLDLTNMGLNRTDGVSGAIHAANDTKPFESNATNITGVDISDWNWLTENHTFTLVLTETGFTWFSGANEIGSGTYADYGIDDEFAAGFKITSMDVNNNAGRGTNSIDSISVDNGAAAGPVQILVTDINYNAVNQTLGLSWTSVAGTTYEIDVLQPNGTWSNVEDGILANGLLTTLNLTNVTNKAGIYQVRAVVP